MSQLAVITNLHIYFMEATRHFNATTHKRMITLGFYKKNAYFKEKRICFNEYGSRRNFLVQNTVDIRLRACRVSAPRCLKTAYNCRI